MKLLNSHERFFGGLLTRLETIQQAIERNGPDSNTDLDYPGQQFSLTWREMRHSVVTDLIKVYTDNRMDKSDGN